MRGNGWEDDKISSEKQPWIQKETSIESNPADNVESDHASYIVPDYGLR